jgi:hypothetical protein
MELLRCQLKQKDFYMHVSSDKKSKTYNRRDSQMVTHSSTSRPVQCLCMAERTECSSVNSRLKSRFLELSSRIPESFSSSRDV